MSRLAGLPRTAVGGVLVPARLRRVGVIRYADGTRELITEEALFGPVSMARLEGAPVLVDDHVRVTPANWSQVVRGLVRKVWREDDYLVGELAIEDAETIARIEAGELHEISCGIARCRVERASGLYGGQPYSAVQRRALYDHVLLCGPGENAGGDDVALMLPRPVGAQGGAA